MSSGLTSSELVMKSFLRNRNSELDFERLVVQFRWSRSQTVFQAEDTAMSSHYFRKHMHWGTGVELARSIHAGQGTPRILSKISS